MKNIFSVIIVVLIFSSCNSDYNSQIELAKKEKCELFVKYEQLKLDSTNTSLREEIFSMERILETHKELSGSPEKFDEELKNFNCK
jgi:hypothetical protein